MSLPPLGEGARGPARGRMRGEYIDFTRNRAATYSLPLISRLRAAASPEGRSLCARR